MKEDLDRQATTARRIVSESLISLIETLGLFVTLAGLLIGSGTIVFRSQNFAHQIIAIALMLVGSLVFFLLPRSVVRLDGSRSKLGNLVKLGSRRRSLAVVGDRQKEPARLPETRV